MNMTAVLVDGVRTPRGKARPDGGLAEVTPLALVESVLTGVLDRTGVDPGEVDEVVVGCASQVAGQGANLARTAVLSAGLPDTVPGVSVNRFCSSGLDAVALGAGLIASGQAEVVLAGGVESVSNVPMFSDDGPLWKDLDVVRRVGSVHMGIAADLVATELGYTRDDLDAYGERTQRLAREAWARGDHGRSLLIPEGATIDRDEHVRDDVTLEALAALPPAFEQLGASGQDELALARVDGLDHIDHLHTRGTSPSVADGAAMTLLASEAAADRLGLTPRAHVVGAAAAGCDPVRMLLAGQLAVEQVLERHGWSADDLDVVEFAEAFSALCLKFQRDLDVDGDRFNPNGGTIAMGHAFGATGAILVTGLIDELERRDARRGAAAVSGAAGSGAALLLERR
jgi:acetyl-CoA C-acetyltransferase